MLKAVESKSPRKPRSLCIRILIPRNQFLEVSFFFFFTSFLYLSFLVHAATPVFRPFCLCSLLWRSTIIVGHHDAFRTTITGVSRILRSVSNTGRRTTGASQVFRDSIVDSESRHSSNRLICPRFSLFLSLYCPRPSLIPWSSAVINKIVFLFITLVLADTAL